MVVAGVRKLAEDVIVHANSNGLPGVPGIHQLLDWAQQLGLFACAAVVLAGAGYFGMGRRTANPAYGDKGRHLVEGGLIGAFVLGFGPALVNVLFHTGTL